MEKYRVSLVAQLVKNLPVMQETLVQFLGWEDPLENGKAIIPVFWPGEFHGLYSPWCCTESDTTEQLSHFTLTSLAYSFLHLFFFSIYSQKTLWHMFPILWGMCTVVARMYLQVCLGVDPSHQFGNMVKYPILKVRKKCLHFILYTARLIPYFSTLVN